MRQTRRQRPIGSAVLVGGLVLLACSSAAGDVQEQLDSLDKQCEAAFEAGRFDEARRLAARMLPMAERFYGGQSLNLPYHLVQLARAEQYLGHNAAVEPLVKRAIRIIESHLGPNDSHLMFPYSLLADSYEALRRDRDAQLALEKRLRLQEKHLEADDLDVADSLHRLGFVRFHQKQYKEAERDFRRALAIREKKLGPDDLQVGRTLGGLAQTLGGAGRAAEAEAMHRRALTVLKAKLGADHLTTGSQLHSLANLYVGQQRFQDAEPLLRQVVAICQKRLGADSMMYADALSELGNLYTDHLARYADAKDAYQRALAVYRNLDESLGVAVTLSNLGKLSHQQGQFADAESAYQSALEISTKLPANQHVHQVRFRNNLGNLYREFGRRAEAETLLKRALAIAESIPDARSPTRERTAVLNNLASLYCDQGRYALAEPLYQRALAEHRKRSEQQSVPAARVLWNLGTLYWDQSRYEEAEPCFQQALAAFTAAYGDQHPETLTILGSLSKFYAIRGDFERSVEYAQRLLAASQTESGDEHPLTGNALGSLALVYFMQGDYAEAAKLRQRQVAAVEKALGPDHEKLADALLGLGSARFMQGKDREAESPLVRAIAIYEQNQTAARLRAAAHRRLAQVRWNLDRRQEAIDELQQSIALAEQHRMHASGAERERAMAFSGLADAFETMVKYQAVLGDTGQAMAAIEQARARSLVDQLESSGGDLLAGLPQDQADSLRAAEAEARTRVAAVERRLTLLERRDDVSEESRAAERKKLTAERAKARAAAYEAYRAVRNASPAIRVALQRDFQPAGLAELESWVAGQQAMLLEYLIGQYQGYLIVIRPGQPSRIVSLELGEEEAKTLGVEPGPLDAERLAAAFRVGNQPLLELLSNPDDAHKAIARLAMLWKLLIPEADREAILDGSIKRLVVSPDGPLALLPFDTLVVEPGRDPKYLLDVGPPIVYGPSATLLYQLSKRKARDSTTARKPVVTVGDPAYEAPDERSPGGSALAGASDSAAYRSFGGEFPRLPFSGLESKWLAQVFQRHGFAADQLSRDDATEARVRAECSDRRFVHLACHGLVDQAYGNLFGALVLASGEAATADASNDGFLNLAEIYELDLDRCELAILSACQTNYGPTQQGEGVWALSRGFIVAGAWRVVASNWIVDDRAAATLMSYFSGIFADELARTGRADYAHALHRAKSLVRREEKWHSPYYWGTFVLVGPD